MGITLKILMGKLYDDGDERPRREHKGKSLLELPDSYCVIDTETTGLSPVYDSLIEVAACRVRDNEIVDTYSSLINPGFEIDEFITDLTGITNDMLAGAPDAATVLKRFVDFVGDSLLVAHNANFDINFLYDSCEEVLNTPFSNSFVDTMRVAKRMFPDFEHYRLRDLVKYYGIEHKDAHRALGDAMATKEVYELLKRDVLIKSVSLSSYITLHAKDITSSKDSFDTTHPLYGKQVCFTGALDKMPRREAMQIVADLGGIPVDSVTKKTNFLVLGNNDYCASIKDGKSAKQKKAEKIKLDGGDIEILPESVFYDMILDADEAVE